MLLKCIIKVRLASTWSTKQQQLTILIVNLQLDFIYFIFFDFMGVACVNAFTIYNMMHQNDLSLLDYKIIVSTHLIGRYTSRSRIPLEQKPGSKRKHQYHFEPNNLPSHLPKFQNSRKRCEYCYKEGSDRKTFVKWTERGLFLCL